MAVPITLFKEYQTCSILTGYKKLAREIQTNQNWRKYGNLK